MLEAGSAAAEWAFDLACAAHPRRHVVARRGRGMMYCQHGRLIGQEARVPRWAVARWLWCGRVCDAGTMRGRWCGPVVAEHGLHALLGGGSHCQMVRTGFWRQMVVSWFDSGGWRDNASLGQNLNCNFALLVGNLWVA